MMDGLIQTVDQKSSVDLMFHLSVFTPEQLAEMDECYQRFGITSYKFYMAGVRGVFPGVADGFVLEGFRKVAEMGDNAVAAIHCEDQSMLDVAFEQLCEATPTGGTLADWTKAHPEIAEEEAVLRAVFLAEKAGNRLYIVHISSELGVERFAEVTAGKPKRYFGETTSAYLSVTKHDQVGLVAKMLPPLRDQGDIEALWRRVADDTLSSLGTDNVSMTKEVKGAEKGMLEAMPGYPILQTHMAAMLTEGYHQRGVPLEAILEKATAGPARVFGLYPQKGTIAVGSDADLVILDLEAERKVDSNELFSYGDFSIHEGRTLKGWPQAVVKDGRVAYRDGEILVEPGAGKYLRRSL
jgi:dihydropyrimidinase